MLPSKHRLNREKDINAILRRGRKIAGVYSILRILPHSHPIPRIGFIVSKKVHNKTNVRNLIKRRMRDIVEAQLPELSLDLDYLFSAHSKAVVANYQDLKLDINNLLHSLNTSSGRYAKNSRSKIY